MNPHQLKRLFPNASEATLRANSKDYGTGRPEPTKAALEAPYRGTAVLRPGISVTILGQIRGGKNNMIVTKRGKHVPKKPWAKWRDQAVTQVQSQIMHLEPFNTPTNVRIDYVAGDRKRRDFPAICDSIWHVLEKAGFVTDDTFLWPAQSTRSYDKANPRATITVMA